MGLSYSKIETGPTKNTLDEKSSFVKISEVFENWNFDGNFVTEMINMVNICNKIGLTPMTSYCLLLAHLTELYNGKVVIIENCDTMNYIDVEFYNNIVQSVKNKDTDQFTNVCVTYNHRMKMSQPLTRLLLRIKNSMTKSDNVTELDTV